VEDGKTGRRGDGKTEDGSRVNSRSGAEIGDQSSSRVTSDPMECHGLGSAT
jgi:hypothetical protein